MEVREHPSFGRLVVEVCTPMLLAFVVAFLLSPPGIAVLFAVVAIGGGPAFILFVVRSVNHHDDPRRMRRPPEPP